MNTALSLAEILARPDAWRADRLAGAALPAFSVVPSGFSALDAELPGGGWARGTLAEVLVDDVGLGECALLMPVLGKMREERKWSLLVAPPHLLNGPAWAACNIDLARLAVVSPRRPRDALWAAEQALSSGALGTLLCWATDIDARQVRRLEVAVAGSRTLAFLFRPARARVESSAAPLRLLLSAGGHGMLGVDLLKRRGPPCSRTLHLDLPRPLQWREDYEPAVACTPSAAPCARSQRPLACV